MSVTLNAPARNIDDICPACQSAQVDLGGQEDPHEVLPQEVPVQTSRPAIQPTWDISSEARYRVRSCRMMTRQNFGLYLKTILASNTPSGPILGNPSEIVLRARLPWMVVDESSNEDTTCAICLAESYSFALHPEDRRVVLPCGHKVGAGCLKALFRQSIFADLTTQSLPNFLTCPSCNTPMMRIRVPAQTSPIDRCQPS